MYLLISSQPGSGNLDIHPVHDAEVYPEVYPKYTCKYTERGWGGDRVHFRHFQKRSKIVVVSPLPGCFRLNVRPITSIRGLVVGWNKKHHTNRRNRVYILHTIRVYNFDMFLFHPLHLLVFQWKRYVSHLQGVYLCLLCYPLFYCFFV